MATITIPKNVLKAVSLFAAKKDARYYLNGVCIKQYKDYSVLVATCGSMLMAYRLDQVSDKELTQIIPIESIKSALSWKAGKRLSDEITIDLEQSAILNADQSSVIKYQAIDATYPDFTQVIPKTLSGEHACFNADLISVCVEAVNLLDTRPIGSFKLRYNGTSCAVVDTPDDNAIVIVMPMRDDLAKAEYIRPNWIDAPVKLEAAA